MRLSRVTIVAAAIVPAAIVAAVILLGAGTVVGYIAGRATVWRFQSTSPAFVLDTATGKVCNPFLFRDTLMRLLATEKMEYKELIEKTA